MGYRILLVDHGSGAAVRLREALARAGHETLGVAGVVEALLAVESRPLDAVLIDEGGAEEALAALCARLANLGRDRRSAVIVLADRVSRVVADPFERARRIGCDRIVDSSISAEELLALLGALLGPPPQTGIESIEDTNRDALSAEAFHAGFDALVTADDHGGDIEAHLDSLFAGARPKAAAAPPIAPAAPARQAAPRTAVTTEPRLPRVAAAPRQPAPPAPVTKPAPAAVVSAAAPAKESVRRPPKALEQLRQPRVAAPPAAAPQRRWPAVQTRAAIIAATVLVAAGGIAGFAWLRPQRAGSSPQAPSPPAAQAAAPVLPPPAPLVAAAVEPPSPAPAPSTETEDPKLPAPPTLEQQPGTVDFGAPALPMGPQVTPKPKPSAAPKATAPPPAPKPKPTTQPATAPVVAEATPPAPAQAAKPEPAPAAPAEVVQAQPAPPQPAPPPAPVEVPTVPPQVLERIEPTYSAQALKKADKSAVIVLRVLVDEQGRISRVVVDQGIPGSELESAAISAVLRWRFRPATEGGTPVAAWTSARFEPKR